MHVFWCSFQQDSGARESVIDEDNKGISEFPEHSGQSFNRVLSYINNLRGWFFFLLNIIDYSHRFHR